jgi:hypothetical protein
LALLPPSLPIPLHRNRKTVKNHLTYFSLTHSTQSGRGHMATGQTPTYLEPPKIKARYMGGEGASGVCFLFFWFFCGIFFFCACPKFLLPDYSRVVGLDPGNRNKTSQDKGCMHGAPPSSNSPLNALSARREVFWSFFFPSRAPQGPKKNKIVYR